jgi:hypothetical protein
MGIDLFVGGHAGTLPGRNGEREREDLAGKRMFTAAHRPNKLLYLDHVQGIIDSGAFTDSLDSRLTPEQSLERQLAWEDKASQLWEHNWLAYGLVSYDVLIDETWSSGERKKQRWSINQAEWAVRETIESARYLAGKREELKPRRLILSCQGVDSIQYRECMTEILKVSIPDDIIGFGGWCILGRMTRYLPEFWRTLRATFPLIQEAGIKDIHIFGVLYQPALGGMLWLADRYGLRISTDSTAPVLACTYKNKKKAGVRVESGYWRDNTDWWVQTLANLRQSPYYKEPPTLELCRQLDLFMEGK